MISSVQDPRLDALTHWVRGTLGLSAATIEPASADASFRRYFRVRDGRVKDGGDKHGAQTRIVMDAPPGKEDLGPFLQAAHLLDVMGVTVPKVLQQDLSQGFLLLSDLGSRQYLPALLAGQDVDRLYGDALAALQKIQACGKSTAGALQPYGAEALGREMSLMPAWFLAEHLQILLDVPTHSMLERVFARLIDSALEQPASFVHRDYHSRNLMILDAGNPGILDFQDALYGAVTYDLVSLLKDCYIAWPADRVRAWLLDFRARRVAAGEPAGRDAAQFERWFDWIGLQRHLKVLGIFARLWYRDGKPGYLHDLPLVLRYVRETAGRYGEFDHFSRWLGEIVQPEFDAAQARVLGGAAAPADAPVAAPASQTAHRPS